MRKRIIALILALATILGCTAFAWEDASSKTEVDYAKELLYKLDIIDAVTKNGYAPDQVLTRAQLADAILGLNGYRDTAAYASCFADVDESTPNAAAIATLLSHGIIASDVNYNPGATAKFEHAVKMIVYTLGFGIVSEAQGGWLQPILSMARSSGVTKGVNVSTGTDLTTDMLVALLYNSLDSDMLERKSLDEFATIEGETLLLKKHGIKKVKGLVTGNAITTLTSADAKEARTSIEWVEYEDVEQIMAPYLGMEAVAYYTEEDGKIIFGYPTDRNQVMEIAADDILPDAAGFGYEAICYREIKESGSAKITKAKVEAEADVIYNGKAYPEYTYDDFKIESGKLVLIDNNRDKIADVVLIEESTNYVVDNVSIPDATVYDMYGDVLDLEDVEFLDITDMYGSKVEVSGFTKWNVLSVVKSLDGEYVKIKVYNDPVSGEIEEYITEDDETYAVIDGDKFEVAASYLAAVAAGHTNAKQLAVGQSGTFYLDGDEKIAAATFEVDSSWQYAYLIKAQMTDEWGVRYRLLMDEKGFKWYDAAEIVRIDEVKKEEDERKTALDDDNENEDERKTVPQLVKVQMNGQGQVKRIDTIARGPKETEDNLSRVITTYAKVDLDGDGTRETTDTSMMRELWSVRTGRFGTSSSVGVLVDRGGSTFIVQAPQNAAEIYDEAKYRYGSTGAGFNNNYELYYNAYDVDWAGIAEAAVIYTTPESALSTDSNSGTIMFVNSVTSKLNDDDEVVKEVSGYDATGLAVTLPVDIDFNIRVDKGDIIRYATNFDGEIYATVTDFNYDEQKNFDKATRLLFSTGDSSASYAGNSVKYATGNVLVGRNGGYIKACAEGVEFATITENMPYNQTQIFSLADATILLYDSVAPAESRYTKISANDLNKYLYANNPNVRVVLYSTYTQLRLVVVYD